VKKHIITPYVIWCLFILMSLLITT